MCLHIDAEEHDLGDLGEPANYKATLFDPKYDKWLDAINVEMQSMKDNDVWTYQNHDEPCVYMKASGSCVTFLILYVDDILIMGNNILMLQDVKSYLGRCFAIKDLGEAAYILRIKIYQDRSKWLIGLCQSTYIDKILKRYFMENSKRGTIPMQEKLKLSKSQGASTPTKKQRMQNVPYPSAVESIMYVVRCTHPDVAFAQNITSRFQQNPEGDMLLLEAFLNDDHSFDFKTKSSSTSLNSLLEETNTFDNSLHEFTTFSNVLCDAEYESESSDNQSCFDEYVLETIISKPLCEEEIIPMESLRTHDSFLPISSKIDSLLDEFVGELTLFKSTSSGIDETDCDFEEDICLIEKLLYDNSSPRPPKEFVSANSDAKIKSFSPSPILVKDSDSLIEEIDLFCTPDYPMPPGIVDEDYDSERDILISKDLRSNNTLSFAEKESFHFDIPSFSRPPAKPPDGDTRILNIKILEMCLDEFKTHLNGTKQAGKYKSSKDSNQESKREEIKGQDGHRFEELQRC
uniref:Putative retrotransposon protein n=1 Tax=Tanacetum cinerariifolium TaxID=118510 RepID=A0A6L2MR60_TANCI|nr:putative retrotransposon protein [Tanacetum cinerariifolium]